MKYTALFTGPIGDPRTFYENVIQASMLDSISKIRIVTSSQLVSYDEAELICVRPEIQSKNEHAKNLPSQLKNIVTGLSDISGPVIRVRADLRIKDYKLLLKVADSALYDGKLLVDRCDSHNPYIQFYYSDFLTVGTAAELRDIFDPVRVLEWDRALQAKKGLVLHPSQGNHFLQKRGNYAEYLIWASYAYKRTACSDVVAMGASNLFTEKALGYLTDRIIPIERSRLFWPEPRLSVGEGYGPYSYFSFLSGGGLSVLRKLRDYCAG